MDTCTSEVSLIWGVTFTDLFFQNLLRGKVSNCYCFDLVNLARRKKEYLYVQTVLTNKCHLWMMVRYKSGTHHYLNHHQVYLPSACREETELRSEGHAPKHRLFYALSFCNFIIDTFYKSIAVVTACLNSTFKLILLKMPLSEVKYSYWLGKGTHVIYWALGGIFDKKNREACHYTIWYISIHVESFILETRI